MTSTITLRSSHRKLTDFGKRPVVQPVKGDKDRVAPSKVKKQKAGR